MALLLMLGLCSTASAADGDSERANVLFKRGKIAFNDGKYADALRLYSEAWRLKQSPDIAANLAQTESELGQHRAAAEHFAYALAHLLPSSTDDQKRALSEGLEQEKRELGALRITLEPADATLSIDDATVTLPPNGELFLDPGEHQAVVTRDGYEPTRQTVRVTRGTSQVLWLKLAQSGAVETDAAKPVTVGPPPNLEHDSPRSLTPALVGGGLVVAGATVGVVFLLAGNSAQNDANSAAASPELASANACGSGTPFGDACARLHDKNSDIDRARTIEITGFAVAGAAAIGTVAYLLWPSSSADAHARPSISPSFAVSPGSTSFGLSGHF